MEVKASHKFARISARKARLVADMIRGKSVDEALIMLENTRKRVACFLEKLIKSAVANAIENEETGADAGDLFIKSIFVNEGPTLKRWRPRAMGRATRINKRTSHLHVVLNDSER